MAVIEWWSSAREFLSEVKTELRNVSWPNKKEVRGTTIVVIFAVIVFGLFLWMSDFVSDAIIRSILRFFTGASS